METAAELKGEWFEGVQTVGISGATSTPQWLMQSVKESVEKRFGTEETVEDIETQAANKS